MQEVESFILWQESYFFAWVTERLPPPPDHFAEFTLTIADCARELWDRFPDISSQKVAERIVRNAIENTKNCIRTNKKGRSVLLELADWKRFLRSYKHRPKKRTGGGDDDDLPNYL